MKIDLHVHTTFSDGEYTPSEILKLCKENDVGILAITDHNNIAGVKNAMKENPYSDITVISGVELSASYPVDGGQLHILGYNMDLNNQQLNYVLKDIMQDSVRRIESLLYHLKKNYGIAFKDKDISDMFSSIGNIGRPEVAKLCVKYGYSSSVKDAFDNLLEPIDHKLVKKKVSLSDKECINYITNAGGVACLAHPITLKKDIHDTMEYINTLMSYGLEAVEVYHSAHSNDFVKELLHMLNYLELTYSVGSDYHGPMVTPNTILGKGINNNLHTETATILSKILRSD